MIDDSNFPDDMTDLDWHLMHIKKQVLLSPPKADVTIANGAISFNDGKFSSYATNALLHPTMKGFWVPISIGAAATVSFGRPDGELIGLRNLRPHVLGSLVLATKKMMSFELSPLLSANKLNISQCSKLTDFDKLPNVLVSLKLNENQLHGNLFKLMQKCSSSCTVLINQLVHNKLEHAQAQRLGHIITKNIISGDDPKAKFYKLQQDLVEAGFEEYV